MVAPSFDYQQASSVQEAIDLLGKNKDATLLAGGHSLLPAMKLRVSAPAMLIDIGKLKELSGIRVSENEIRIGALTTHAEIAASEELLKLCPIITETAQQIGDLQVRNRGTIGGSLAHADPAADFPTTILALGATLVAQGPSGQREIPANEFFTGMFETALQADELLVELRLPSMKSGEGGSYVKHSHPASSYAVVGVAAILTVENNKCTDARLAIGGVTANPVLASAAQSALIGQTPDEESFSAAAARISEAITNPLGDIYASGEYRVHLAGLMARQALVSAAMQAAG